MANHCYNYGFFVGSRIEIEKLFAQVNKLEEENAENKFPQKTDTTNQVELWAANYSKVLMNKPDQAEDGSFPTKFDVYDKYGSKWFDAYFEVQKLHGEDEVGLVISGDSAWSPMLPFFAKLCKKYKLTCEGNYEESGMGFAGEFVIDKDGNVEEEQMTYTEFEQKNNPDSYWDQLLSNIEDGCYTKLEYVYAEFNPKTWKLMEHEEEELKECFDKYLASIDEQKTI
jgi:hypothetical protein